MFNASSGSGGPSLNQCLHKGPTLMPELVRVLIGFRCHRIAVVGDLEKAFLKVEVDPKDCDFLRTLWVKNFDPKSTDEKFDLVILRFSVCVFGVTSSPFHLMATTKYHCDKYRHAYPEIVEEIQRSMFVDDLISGADSVSDEHTLFTTAKLIFKEGGFNLRKFATNSSELRSIIEAEMNSKSEKVTKEGEGEIYSSFAEMTQQSFENPKTSNEQKVLGVVWNKEADKWIFRFDALIEVAQKLKRTRRGLLQLFARIYDPLGLISPILIPMKVTFQSTCGSGLEWNTKLSKEQVKCVEEWLADLKEVGQIDYPRYCLNFKRSEILKTQIVGFSDASSLAFGAVVYIRTEVSDKTEVNLIMSKSRVAPQKKVTIPRL